MAGCGCKKSSTQQSWQVRMPGPEKRVKSYSSEIVARAVNAKIAGSVLIPPSTVG